MNFREMKFPAGLTLTVCILVVLAGVFLAIREVIMTIDVSQLTEPALTLYGMAKTFFTWGPVAAFVGWLMNIVGYLRTQAKLAAFNQPGTPYNIQRFYSTMVYYLGLMETFATGIAEPLSKVLPPPYNAIIGQGVAIIASAIVVLIDILGSEVKHILGTVKPIWGPPPEK